MQELKVGQNLYGKPVNNRARYGNETIIEATIEKIGRKYITLKGRKTKLDMELREVSDYCADYEWYLSEQDILDERELDKLCRKIESYFAWHSRNKVNLSQARRIMAILEEE